MSRMLLTSNPLHDSIAAKQSNNQNNVTYVPFLLTLVLVL